MDGSVESPQQTPRTPHSSAVPIADYGFLSDGEVTALVAPGGDVDWMCLPRMDSPSIFGALLGRHAGRFRLGAVGRRRADGAPLPAGHDGAGDELGDADRLDHRPRRRC